MPLTISRAGADYRPDAAVRAAFRAQGWVKLAALLENALLTRVMSGIASGTFTEVHHRDVTAGSVDLRMTPGAITGLLALVCNDPRVLDAIADLTGCAGITRFNGSVYRMMAGAGHQQEWHDDAAQDRLVALSVNVGDAAYEGGTLEMRESDTSRVIAAVPNPTPGDAVLFRIHSTLEHRVTPVTAGVKTAFAGWFRAGPRLRQELEAATGTLVLRA